MADTVGEGDVPLKGKVGSGTCERCKNGHTDGDALLAQPTIKAAGFS